MTTKEIKGGALRFVKADGRWTVERARVIWTRKSDGRAFEGRLSGSVTRSSNGVSVYFEADGGGWTNARYADLEFLGAGDFRDWYGRPVEVAA